ncbi:MAG TPA: glycoside hydrolase family 3 C-terminal domain-containing protein [Anaerolineaceae bacterium]|nr:glycoside hydrolase family 3 C-terminal domain-containing protein [Anaerolineaceae bacterium]
MQDIQSIISQMTLEEKAALCTGATVWTTQEVERLGVPSITMSDGPHGVRRVANATGLTSKSIPATAFPTASCTASTWDLDLVREMGAAIGQECVALGVDVLLGPSNNMKRTPLCGRNFEYFSEDPFLSGELSASWIDGVQSQGVGASLKHFAANNQEYQRLCIDARIDERTLREIYLAAFETAVKKARPWTVMCAYNKLNGVTCSEHHELLVDILKKEWGFEGVVVSDWGAVHDRVAALKGGLDLEMPGPKQRRVQAVVDAVRAGELDEAAVDEAVRRILRIVFLAEETVKGGGFDAAGHHALARKIAGEGMVLLKNNGVLPLKNPQRIAVIGRAAQEPCFEGGGSSHVNPTRVDDPLEELKKAAPANTEFTYSEGYPKDDSLRQDLIDAAAEQARAAGVALLYIALPGYIESEGYDRPGLDLTPQQVALIQAVYTVQPNTVVILHNGSAVAMSEWIDGAAAVLEAWMMGQAGGGAIADILFGKVNPSGKLAETFPVRLVDTPAQINFPGEYGQVRYGEGLFIGYRYYESKDMPVLFPFGFGLSYTSFDYRSSRISARTFRDVDGLTVSVDVTNSGAMAGKEVVQFYVRDHQASVARPVKELKGFVKLDLAPGETKTATIHLDTRAFSFYHPVHRRWVAESGRFDILIGASAADIRCVETVTLQSTVELPCILNNESTVREWLEDPHGRPVFEPLYRRLKAQMKEVFGGGEENKSAIGMDTELFFMDMPLSGILDHIPEERLPRPAEEMIEEMLDQVYRRAA